MSLRYFASAAIAAVLVATGLCAQAQKTFPGKPVRMVVPFPPGQATDIVARLLADALTRAWDQQVIVAQAGAPYGSLKDLEDAAKKERAS